MDRKQVNVAIVGLGFGAEFIPIYQRHPCAVLYAICQRNEERLNQIGEAFGVQTRYTRYEDVLADPNVDFMHINTPIRDHAPMSIAALKAGKHVLCTVPMATTVEERREIVEIVRRTGLKYMMAETVVYSREFLFLKELYRRGDLGKIQYLQASHPHLVHEFVSALLDGRDPWPNAVQSANWTCVGLCAHESAMNGGKIVALPSFTRIWACPSGR